MAASLQFPLLRTVSPVIADLGRAAKRPSGLEPRLGRIDLTDLSEDPTPGADGLVAEISAPITIADRFYTISSGGSSRITLTDWTDPGAPFVRRQLHLEGVFTTSVDAFGDLVAIATTADDSDAPGLTPSASAVRFYRATPARKHTGDVILRELGRVTTGFLTDAVRFSADGSHLYAANEGQPNLDHSQDPRGSISILAIKGRPAKPRFEEVEIKLPAPDGPSVTLLGHGLRSDTGEAPTLTFAQDAEPENVAEAGGYLFATLQENNTVVRLDLATDRVAYFGLGWVNYSQVAVDLTDEDLDDGTASSDGFHPLTGQNLVGLRMPDGITAWTLKGDVLFAIANEGDSREYTDGDIAGIYLDESRNKDLAGSYPLPGRIKLIVDGNQPFIGNPDDEIKSNAFILDQNPGGTAAQDFSFEDTSKSTDGTPVGFGSRSLSLFDGLTGELLWDSWMMDAIDGVAYNTSLQNIAVHAGVYDDGRSDDKGVEPEAVAVLRYRGHRYLVGAMERTSAGDKDEANGLDLVTQGGLLVVYDVSNPRDVDFVTYQQVSRSPEGLEVIPASQSPVGRVLLAVSNEYDSNSVEFLDFGSVLRNGNGAGYLASDLANPSLFATLAAV